MKGKIGGISFYKSGGVDLARVANGPSKEKIQKDPAFQRTRENNVEFGGCATVTKALRLALGNRRMILADAKIVARMVKIFKEINLNGTGSRGQRSIDLAGNTTLLQNFEFNTGTPFTSVFNAPYSILTTAARDEATITVSAFLPSSFVNAPSGATHFRIFAILCTLSEYVYDSVTGRYIATDPTIDMLNAEADSAVTDLSTTTPVSFTLNPVLPGSPTMNATTSAVLCIGCEFFQHVGVNDYLLAQGDCMRVIKVF